MVSIVLTAEQVKGAPSEVRRWIEATLRKELSLEQHHPYQRNGFRYAENGLAICTLAETSQIFTLLRQDPAACRLLLALGADNYDRTHGRHSSRPVAIAELERQFGVSDTAALLPLIETVNNAVRQVRGDEGAILLTVDGEDRVLLHPETQWHIFQLLQILTGTEAQHDAPPPRPDTRRVAAPPPDQPERLQPAADFVAL
jgi:hypothetical protein